MEQLQEAGVEASVSSVLPDDFLVATGLQHLIRQGFMQQGRCQVNHRHPAWLTTAGPIFSLHFLTFHFLMSYFVL